MSNTLGGKKPTAEEKLARLRAGAQTAAQSELGIPIEPVQAPPTRSGLPENVQSARLGAGPTTAQKQRHGCLTTFLVLMLVGNAASLLVYLFAGASIGQALPNFPAWGVPVLTLIGAFNLACSIALLNWRKWGFWGVLVSSVAAFIVNIAVGLGLGALPGLLGIAILYGVLQIGKDNNGWSQLE